MRCQRLGDVAVAPDEDVGVAEGSKAVLGAVGLGAAEVSRPLPLHLVVAHLIEAPRGDQQQTEGVLGDGAVVAPRARRHNHIGREAGRQHVVGPGGKRLDPAEVLHAARGVLQVLGAVGPGDEDLGVDQVLGDHGLDVIGVQRGAEALEAGDVELERGWVEKLHDGPVIECSGRIAVVEEVVSGTSKGVGEWMDFLFSPSGRDAAAAAAAELLPAKLAARLQAGVSKCVKVWVDYMHTGASALRIIPRYSVLDEGRDHEGSTLLTIEAAVLGV